MIPNIKTLMYLSYVMVSTGCSPENPLQHPGVSFRWAQSQPADGFIEARVQSETVYIAPEVLLSGKQFEPVLATRCQNEELCIMIMVAPEARDHLAKKTANATGRRVALIVDGIAVRVFPLNGPLREGIVLSGFLDEIEARDLADRINRFRTAR